MNHILFYLIFLSSSGRFSLSHPLFPREAIPESFVRQYLEKAGKIVQSQLKALREVSDLFDSMRRRDKELVNMVNITHIHTYCIYIRTYCMCIHTYIHTYVQIGCMLFILHRYIYWVYNIYSVCSYMYLKYIILVCFCIF